MLHALRSLPTMQPSPRMLVWAFIFAVVVLVAERCVHHQVIPEMAAVMSNSAVWGHYRDWLIGKQRSPVTISEYYRTLRDLFGYLHTQKVTGPDGAKVPRQWHQVRPQDYYRWLDRPLARNSQHTYSKRVLHFYRLAARKRWLPGRNPLADIDPVRPAARKPRALPLDSVGLLFAQLTDLRLNMMVQLAYYQLLRIGEICRLSVEDLDFSSVPPMMRIQGKGDQETWMDINSALVPGLRAWLVSRPPTGPLIPNYTHPGEHLDPKYASHLLAVAMRPIVGDSAHALRHTAATELLAATDENIRKVQVALRHGSIKSTEGYVLTRPGRLVAWLDLLPDPLHPPSAAPGA